MLPVWPILVLALVALAAIGLGITLRAPKSPAYQTVDIGGGSALVTIPGTLLIMVDADGTVLARPPGEECITLRFTVINAKAKDPNSNSPLQQFVREGAEAKGRTATIRGRRAIDHYRESVEDDGTPVTMHYWEIGEEESLIVVSATVLAERQQGPRVLELLAQMPTIVESIVLRSYRKTISTPIGLAEATVTVEDPSPQAIRDFTGEERTWLETRLERARELIDRHGGHEFDDPLDPRELDRVFTHWLQANPEKRVSGDELAEALGAAFGEYCVRVLGMRWVVVTDEYGASRAIRHEAGETMAFPIDSVLKRIESGQTNFLLVIFHGVRERIAEAQAPRGP